MKKLIKALAALTALASFAAGPVLSQPVTDLKIDPLLLVSLKECRNIAKTLGKELYPGWDFAKTPVLFYRPKIQELLINFPHQPKGFSLYTGFNPLGAETIYVRNDTTLFDVDDQNTSREIDGIPVLVVADPFSRMRSQIGSVLTQRSKEFATKWLEDWNFLESPYFELQVILHEAFHVYQNKRAPDKGANEMVVSQYPLLDPVNNALYVLEGNILKDALLSQNPTSRLEKIKEFVAVRSFRQSRLDSSWVEYENLNEFAEGTAKYLEYKFLKAGESVEPIPEMYYHNGFNGYRGVLTQRFEDAMKNMVNIVAVNDDRFGNKFGSGPLRFKLYDLGACQALLLDELMPTWKEKIFAESVYLCGLLKQATGLSPAGLEAYLQRAKTEYRYEEAYRSKLQFEQEGKKKIGEKLASILQTDRTLVKIFYEGFVDRIGLGGFTPFGVTQVSKQSAIYDLVPIKVRFKEGVELQMKQVTPVLIDREKKMIAFAVSTPAAKFDIGFENTLETDEFVLSSATIDIKRQGNTIEIVLK
ncbi:MAG: hypothetical protein ACM3YF_00015 [Candidatus Zixiibacteriota bacterium]